MERFHLNARGEAAECGSKTRECRYGTDAEHFDSFDEARFEFEEWMKELTIPRPLRKAPKRGPVVAAAPVKPAVVVRERPETPRETVSLPPVNDSAFVRAEEDSFDSMMKEFLD